MAKDAGSFVMRAQLSKDLFINLLGTNAINDFGLMAKEKAYWLGFQIR